ncbi:Alpha/beta hydrolase family [Actinomyces bovis]|uniref:Alpha/beta hydrolase family n=1 Tax=Actinomyces bovis TaxID=1658 RepID=A0ABY1VMA4_9ACTO|nr:alpha/beta hydrolase [Actinomyces bovis]SPT52882.1 Alpha/beta hydrolase family [Actinomyces bovis]VEG55006.1 Alpha/beta hydrolase family [Actinomyces israelii]
MNSEPAADDSRFGGLRLLTTGPAGGAPARMLVVLLPGAALPAEFWQEVPALLPQDLVVAVDRRAQETASSAKVPLLREQTQELIDALDSLRAQPEAAGLPLLLVAHSMAAFAAEAVIRLRPELVAGLVLVDPSLAVALKLPRPMAACRLPGTGVPLLAAACQSATRTLLRLSPVRQAVSGLLLTAVRHELRRPEALDQETWEQAWVPPTALAARAAEFFAYSGQLDELIALRQSDVAAVAVPTILLEAAPAASAAEVRHTYHAFSNLRIRHVRSAGHLVALDAPGVVARAIDDLGRVLNGLR